MFVENEHLNAVYRGYNPEFVKNALAKRSAAAQRAKAEAIAADARAIAEERAAIKDARERVVRQVALSEFGKQMRDRHVPEWVADIVVDAAKKYNVFPSEIMSPSRSKRVVQARSEALYRVKDRSPCVSFPRIGKWFARDHTSVMHSVANFADLNGYPQLCGYDIKRLRVRNAQISADRRRQHSDRET